MLTLFDEPPRLLASLRAAGAGSEARRPSTSFSNALVTSALRGGYANLLDAC